MTYLAYYAAREGDLERAHSLLEGATEQYRLAGDLVGVSGCIHALGDIALERGEIDTALERYLEAQPKMLQAGTTHDLMYVLGGIAAVAALQGRSESAARLWGAVERLDAEAERRMDSEGRACYERALGELDAAELEAGHGLTDDEAVKLARETAAELAVQRSSSR